jgi:hypothetical protein
MSQSVASGIAWQKQSKWKWRGDNGMIITDESFTVGGVKTRFYPVYLTQEAHHVGDNFASGATINEARAKAEANHG